jgi:YlmC/YmxH family sporulation protein
MQNRIADLRCKEVINICNGDRLGFVDDVLLDTATGKLIAIIVPGPCKCLGLFGRDDDYIIPWECIVKMGEDIILAEVRTEYKKERRSKGNWL